MDWQFKKGRAGRLLSAVPSGMSLSSESRRGDTRNFHMEGLWQNLVHVQVWFYGYQLFNIYEILLFQSVMRSSQA